MKKFLCILLTAALLCAALAVPAAAAGAYEGKTVLIVTGNLRGGLDVYPQLAAAKAAYEAAGAEVVLADAGNAIQGSAAANMSRGAAVYDLMDAVGYSVLAMGPAEFSYGGASTGMIYHGNLKRYYTQSMLQNGCEAAEYNVNREGSQSAVLDAREPAGFAAVCANITASDAYAYEPSCIVETAAGLKLGFYGITDPAVKEQVQDGFISAAAAPAPMAVEGADLTVALGYFPGADAAYGAVAADVSGGEAFVKAYVIDNARKTVTEEDVDLSGSDEAIAALAAAAKEGAEAVGTSKVILNGADSVNWAGESNLGDFVTDALLWYAENYLDGIDKTLPMVAVQNGGNCDQFLYTGDITGTDLLYALPFSPMGIGAIVVTGQELLETLEAGTCPSEKYGDLCPGFAQVAGLTYTVDLNEDYDGGEAYGSFYVADSVTRVTISDVGGEPFDASAKYLLIADNYLINGNDTYYTLKAAREAGAAYVSNGPGVKVRDIAAMYIAQVLDGEIGEAYAAPQGRITVIPKEDEPEQPAEAEGFADVPADAYFADAVAWAVEQGITAGTSDTAFLPYAPCTRAQLVTFLWRAAGSPTAGKAPHAFGDLAEGAYYLPAVEWAVANGITTGVTPTEFAPDRAVTRGEAVTFLYRWEGMPLVQGESAAFDDVPEDAFFARPVMWAEQNGITTGIGPGLFGPWIPCTRAQIVTFLYRSARP